MEKCPIIVCVLAAVAVEAVMLLVQGSGMLWSVVVVADEGKNKAVGPVQGGQLLHTISPKY